jgi:hypothetical protein
MGETYRAHGRGETHKQFSLESLKEGLGVDWKVILKCVSGEWGGRVWPGFM